VPGSLCAPSGGLPGGCSVIVIFRSQRGPPSETQPVRCFAQEALEVASENMSSPELPLGNSASLELALENRLPSVGSTTQLPLSCLEKAASFELLLVVLARPATCSRETSFLELPLQKMAFFKLLLFY
jgi:hypothetical protein